MTSAETLLRQAAEDNTLDSAEWPKALQYILHRLDEIVADFPRPPVSSAAPTAPAVSSQESHATDKENAPPSAAASALNLPADMTTFYASIRRALSTNFASDPPHTVQRLAELILDPKKRYKFLPSYLRALDRVVSVSSPLTLFPLPQAVLPTAGGLLNGTSSAINTQTPTLGSDESLGGALLTPIPWLQNRGQNELVSESTEIVDGPNGAGRIETVTVGMLPGRTRQDTSSTSTTSTPPSQIASSHPDGETLPSTGPVTQGELLRQEQEAGIVLNNPHALTTSPTRTMHAHSDGGPDMVRETVEADDEAPHARGPEEIGMEDTGPQRGAGGLDIEGAVGRPSVERASRSPGVTEEEGEKDEEMKDKEYVKVDDEDGKEEVKKESEDGDVEMKSDE